MTTATAPELLCEHREGVMTLTLNRPEVLNALTLAMMGGLLESLKRAQKDPETRCVVLTAAGRAFCAGADLGDLQRRQAQAPFSLGDELRWHFNPLILQIRRMEKPVIGVANGLAAGAGASLILSCDLKVCSKDATFINAFVKVGLVPDSGMTYFLPRYMGLSLALEHAWTAKPITAQQALHFGWVNRVVPSEGLSAATSEIAGELLRASPLSLGLTKRAMNRSLDNNFEGQLEYEAQLQEILGKTNDHAEGVAAFLEKRPPKFEGR
jgi:2-(1,2-epoxy-1,2-dihydrophenyl)acetyl-CoA isomerase